jgi:hypothetical protein
MPDVCVSNCSIVMSRLSAGTGPRNRLIRSLTRSRPIASSFRIAAAVNCFVIDPVSYTVRQLAGVPAARSAVPKPPQYASSSPRAAITVPLAPAGRVRWRKSATDSPSRAFGAAAADPVAGLPAAGSSAHAPIISRAARAVTAAPVRRQRGRPI